MRGGLTIFPGFIRPRGSSQALISPRQAVRRGPKNGAIHSERTRPSPCSPEYAPLNSFTMAHASSAMARIFSAPSRRMSSTGRTCRVPTEACAYQVPRVPCFSNTRVSRSVYSARCSRGTAQSSMKDTGLPSPFIDIMMFSPALRISHTAFCRGASVISTTAPGKPRSPSRWVSSLNLESCVAASSPENSTSRIASGSPLISASTVFLKAGMSRARAIIVRSTSSTAEGASGTVRRIRVRRTEMIQVVACDFAQQLGKAGLDLLLFALVKILQLLHELAVSGGVRGLVQRTETPALACGGHRFDGEHVVHHVAVGDRARAAGVVARHAAERRLRARRHVDREPQPMRPQSGIQRVEHYAGLDDGARRL